jgi:hypothetical protein
MVTGGDEEVHDSPIGWVRRHALRYVQTAGEDGHIKQGLANLLLTTRGRKSGVLRRTPLVYAPDGDGYVLSASNGASPLRPAVVPQPRRRAECRRADRRRRLRRFAALLHGLGAAIGAGAPPRLAADVLWAGLRVPKVSPMAHGKRS